MALRPALAALTELELLVGRVGEALLARQAVLVTAESCTGGLVAAACTSVAGSSRWFERGLVTYSNAAKQELLGVAPALLDRHGAVSAEVARAMAEGALTRSSAAVSVAVTGIAGPGGGTSAKPVGTVWIAVAAPNRPAEATLLQASGDRTSIRAQSVRKALELVLEAAQRKLRP